MATKPPTRHETPYDTPNLFLLVKSRNRFRATASLRLLEDHEILRQVHAMKRFNKNTIFSWFKKNVSGSIYLKLIIIRQFRYTQFIWRFPEMGVPPSHHPFLDGILYEINHPAIGGSPILGNLHIYS